MGEGLREVAAGLPGHRGFLGEQAQVVRVTEHALEGEPGLVETGSVVPPARVRASTSQKVQMLKVASSPVRPSGLARVL